MPELSTASQSDMQTLVAIREHNSLLEVENRVLAAALGQDLGPSTSSDALPLTLHEKIEVVTTELEKAQMQLHSVSEEQEDSLARLECRAQAARAASHRCRMEASELQRKLRDPGLAIANAHVNAEALMTHLASVTERKREAAEQYAGKARRLKAQCQALQAEKRGPNSRLHPIDLEELRMGNTRLVRGIEEHAQKVVQQKLATGRSAKVLEQQQKILTGLLDSCYNTSRDIAMREAQLVKFDKETKKYNQREQVASHQVATYKQLRQSAPTVADYIRLKNEVAAGGSKIEHV